MCSEFGPILPSRNSILTHHPTKSYFKTAASEHWATVRDTKHWNIASRLSAFTVPEHQSARDNVQCCKTAARNRFVPTFLMLPCLRKETNHPLTQFSERHLIIGTSDKLSLSNRSSLDSRSRSSKNFFKKPFRSHLATELLSPKLPDKAPATELTDQHQPVRYSVSNGLD